MKHQLMILAALLLTTNTVAAQKNRFRVFKEDSDNRAQIRNNKPLSVFYEKISWNQDPLQIETGFLYLRDRNSGELIEIKLTETKPNSSVFNMDYPIGAIKKRKIATEIYSAPQSMLKGKGRKSIMKDLIEDGSVKRKPFLLRVLRAKGQIVDVFDSKELALAAYNSYRKQMGLDPGQNESESIIQVANKEKPDSKKVIDASTLQSLFMANENNLAATNEKNRELREVLRNIELKRREKILTDAKTWGSTKRSSKKRLAQSKIKEAVKQIKKSQTQLSMKSFFQASDLMPEQQDVYEQYGVSLFRDKKFNQAIVVLDISQPSENRLAEKDFYLGSAYYQLKDYKKAIEHFDKVIASGNKSFGPTAAFYKGSALLELKEYDKSKEAFQYVLNNSENPEMDKRAEKFIEYSLEKKTLDEKRSSWFFIDGVLGLIYDDNIIFADDQARDQGTATDVEGWRTLLQIAPRVRPYYSESDEINIVADFTYIKSFDEDFSNNPTAETADPTIYSISVPWTHRTTLDGKGYFFDLTPSYQNIIMDLDDSGSATITETVKLAMNNTLVIDRNWIAKGDYFVAQNDSNILGDEEGADSIASGIKLSSIFILNKDLERYLIPEFGYQFNNAEASNYNFNRIDLALTYTTSIFDSFMWNNRIAYFLANYENTRSDNNYTFTSGISTKLSTHWNWGLMGSYIINDSTGTNETGNPYKKYNFVTTFSFSY